jgi:hypothetical protein
MAGVQGAAGRGVGERELLGNFWKAPGSLGLQGSLELNTHDPRQRPEEMDDSDIIHGGECNSALILPTMVMN